VKSGELRVKDFFDILINFRMIPNEFMIFNDYENMILEQKRF